MNIGLDVDGTLCDTGPDVDLDDASSILAGCRPRARMLERVKDLAAGGHVLDVVTARGPHVRNATLQQLEAWFPGVTIRHVMHRPRLTFDIADYVTDKTTHLRKLRTDVYVGDRVEDRAAALRAGARFLWHHQLEAHGLQVPA